MNLNPLFQKQAELDEYIVKRKNLEGHDLLKMKTVALICELYEFANEARFFKYWSNDTNPKRDTLLEEYVDMIHFVISIANDLGVHEHKYVTTQPKGPNDLILGITNLATIIPTSKSKEHVKSLLNNIITLGYYFGLTEEQVLEAYEKKNEINYARQNSDY